MARFRRKAPVRLNPHESPLVQGVPQDKTAVPAFFRFSIGARCGFFSCFLLV
jgi:hypothetical protein